MAKEEISSEHAAAFVRSAKHRFTEDKLREHTQGATYVNFADMVAISLFESNYQQTMCVINDSPDRGNRQSTKRQCLDLTIVAYTHQSSANQRLQRFWNSIPSNSII